ncbi:MAG: hypothetical protein AAB837_00070 [Patescibacteria group bacterium]
MKKILLIILILGLAGTGYFLAKNNKTTQNIKEQKYSHENPAFSFSYTGDYKISSIADESGEAILVQSEEFQMQIYTAPFDEDIVLTEERIKQDVPDMAMENTNVFSLDDVNGVVFESEGMQNVWVVNDGFLYQISTYLNQKEEMQKILDKWEW